MPVGEIWTNYMYRREHLKTNLRFWLIWIPDPHFRMSDRANLESIQNIVDFICDFKRKFLESFPILQRFHEIFLLWKSYVARASIGNRNEEFRIEMNSLMFLFHLLIHLHSFFIVCQFIRMNVARYRIFIAWFNHFYQNILKIT